MMELLAKPEFWDIFGLPNFIFIALLALWILRKDKKPPKWAAVALLLIGIGGVIVDGIIVYNYFLK